MEFDVANWFLVFARVGAILLGLPMFSASHFPVAIRVALAALLAFLIVPLVPAYPMAGSSFWSLLHVLAGEVLIGLLLGFICRMVFLALEMGGGIIANEMGLSVAPQINPLTGGMSQAPELIVYWLSVMLFLSLDLHHWTLAAIQRSYVLLPVGHAHLSESLMLDLVGRTAGVFAISLQIAAPLMAVSFVLSLVFSVLGRAVPQMNVFSESFSIRTIAGLLVFGLSCRFMAEHMSKYLQRLPEDMLRVASILANG